MTTHVINSADPYVFIRSNIGKHKQFALGTTDSSGNPWVVCLNLAYDQRYNMIWKSSKNAQHSVHLRSKPNVAICIFSEVDGVGDFGFYAKAVAEEVSDPDLLSTLLRIRYSKSGRQTPDTKAFLDESEERIYFARLTELWVNDDSHKKQEVDLRVFNEVSG